MVRELLETQDSKTFDKLYDKDGKEGQLTGTYVDKNGHKIVRGEDTHFALACISQQKMQRWNLAVPSSHFFDD